MTVCYHISVVKSSDFRKIFQVFLYIIKNTPKALFFKGFGAVFKQRNPRFRIQFIVKDRDWLQQFFDMQKRQSVYSAVNFNRNSFWDNPLP